MTKYIKVEVFVPGEYVVKIVNALNEKDILKDGNYDYVFSLTDVKGHFRPIEGANPFIGTIGVVEQVNEKKMEFRINAEDMGEVKKIIEINHPYEAPVINFYELIN